MSYIQSKYQSRGHELGNRKLSNNLKYNLIKMTIHFFSDFENDKDKQYSECLLFVARDIAKLLTNHTAH